MLVLIPIQFDQNELLIHLEGLNGAAVGLDTVYIKANNSINVQHQIHSEMP